MIRVHSAQNAFEAHMVKSALQQAGIRVVLKNEMLAALAGALPMTEVMAEVWIDEKDAETAAIILAPFFERKGGELSLREGAIGGELSLGEVDARTCAKCGEESPSHFGQCWQCEEAFE